MTIWPLYVLAAIFGLYTLKGIIVHLWDESTHMSVGEIEDYIHHIEPTETPFSRIMRENAQYRKETLEGKDSV